MNKIEVTTPTCIHCGRTSTLSVNPYAYQAWQQGALIQNAFPNMTEDEREMLKTGIHPDCWDRIHGVDPGTEDKWWEVVD